MFVYLCVKEGIKTGHFTARIEWPFIIKTHIKCSTALSRTDNTWVIYVDIKEYEEAYAPGSNSGDFEII